jgi:hypothetical protein
MKKSGGVPVLIPVLAIAFISFIGILVYVWIEAKKANPKMLDEHGRVKNTAVLVRHPPRRT